MKKIFIFFLCLIFCVSLALPAYTIGYGLSPAPSDLLPASTRDEIEKTLESSLAAAAAAFELLPSDAASPIVGNIIYLGIPSVISQVLNRTKDKKRKKKG